MCEEDTFLFTPRYRLHIVLDPDLNGRALYFYPLEVNHTRFRPACVVPIYTARDSLGVVLKAGVTNISTCMLGVGYKRENQRVSCRRCAENLYFWCWILYKETSNATFSTTRS